MSEDMGLFDWIRRELTPRQCTSDAFIYDEMDSQSGHSLPIIYQPFDARRKGHWTDRGAVWDHLYATQGEGKRLLDLGPGDGWPSLIVAPWAGEVVGLDGSQRRVEVCRANAARLGLANARFQHVPPGAPLPFPEGSFDGAMAASSLEQTPDPRATLAELRRVLCPGGRLRLSYESLARYRGGSERETWLWPLDERRAQLILFDRRIAEEQVVQYGLTFDLPVRALREAFSCEGKQIPFAALTLPRFRALRPAIADARVCTTQHPSGPTLVRWLRGAGFREVWPTHDGLELAGRLFEVLPAEGRPGDLEGVDAYLRPIVRAVVDLPAPAEINPMITAVK